MVIHPDGKTIVYIGISTDTRIHISINIIHSPGGVPPALRNTSSINKDLVVCYQFITSSRINTSWISSSRDLVVYFQFTTSRRTCYKLN